MAYQQSNPTFISLSQRGRQRCSEEKPGQKCTLAGKHGCPGQGWGDVMGEGEWGAAVYSAWNDLKLDYLLSYLYPLLKFTFSASLLLPFTPRPPVPPQRKRVDGPFVIGRVGGALSGAFQAAGAYSKAGVSAPPPGVFVPAPRFPPLPRRAEN